MNFRFIYYMLIGAFLFGSCDNRGNEKVLYINSYHSGYPPSDAVQDEIISILTANNIDLEIFYLDSKRNENNEFIRKKTDSIVFLVKGFKPDVIIASDDNAIKYVIEPWYTDGSVPVVFCGVNWSADQYDLPKEYITGMLETLALRECIELAMEKTKSLSKIAILSENSLSERNNTSLLDTLYRNMGLEPLYMLVDDFDQWKQSFVEAGNITDIIYLPTNGAIKDWDDEEARSFVSENIQTPVFSCDDFMMEFCSFGLTKVPAEQGEWAAHTALKIIKGKSPGDIAVTKNSKWQSWINPGLMEKTEMIPTKEWLDTSIIVE